MQFLISDTFTSSLARLSGDEQKAVKTAAFDLQMNPVSTGAQLHRLDKARDPNFWSARAGSDVRIILHRTPQSMLLCYAGHHDDAYRWAERRRLETHPTTGAAQFVEIRETVMEFATIGPAQASQVPQGSLFDHLTDDDLLSYGVPSEWIESVRSADDVSLLELGDHLPAEAAEALLAIAVGETPRSHAVIEPEADPFQHPDAARRFRIIDNTEELAAALEFPWDRWTVFLHPSQRQLVEASFSGPARVSGSAGTGKTIVALHRAVHLAECDPDVQVLLTTFSEPLANGLRTRLRRLIFKQPALAERIEIGDLDTIAERLYKRRIGKLNLATPVEISAIIEHVSSEMDLQKFSLRFLISEWHDVVDAWQIATWEEYRDVRRLGRKTRLPEARREELWRIFEQVQERLSADGLVAHAGMYRRLTDRFERDTSPYDHIVVDEAQDLTVPQLRFLAALGSDLPDALFFAGDLGQRIFQQPFSWMALGVSVRGRSRTLNVNYRTSHQIRTQADRLLAPEVSDVDGNVEKRSGTVSVFNGPKPQVRLFDSQDDEASSTAAWLTELSANSVQSHEIGVFVRSEAQLDRTRGAVERAGLLHAALDESVEGESGRVTISTMHLAKGLEFRAVAVMACDDEVMPLQERIETAADSSDLEEVYNTERHLLYVALTRARDYLLVTGVKPGSEFLEDIK